MRFLSLWWTILRLCGGSLAVAAPPGDFAFQDQDRVVMLGGTTIEREVNYGYLETALTSANPELNLMFRNLGGSGDTVWGDWRGLIDAPAAGGQRMRELVRELRPTVLLLAFGANESFVGESGVEPFIRQYEKLLDDLAPPGCRLVFLTPHQFETPPAPLPDASRYNPMLGRYAQAIRELAERRGGWLVDLHESTATMTWAPDTVEVESSEKLEAPRGFRRTNGVWSSLPLTDNGMHLSAYGSLRMARMAIHQLKLPKAEFLMQLAVDGEADSQHQASLSDYTGDSTSARFQLRLSRLPEPPTPLFPADVEYFLVAGELPLGKYELKIDGRTVTTNPALLVNFPVRRGPDFDQAEWLRLAIVAKNKLFLQRWRPQNIEHRIGIRNHEPGNNAVEVARLGASMAELEEKITELRRPVPHTYEIVPQTDGR